MDCSISILRFAQGKHEGMQITSTMSDTTAAKVELNDPNNLDRVTLWMTVLLSYWIWHWKTHASMSTTASCLDQ